MKIQYEPHVFKGRARDLIEKANAIIESYASQGYSMTLRQLYYQLVVENIIPNKQREYDRLGVTISDARRAGLVDWDAIVDHTRFIRTPPSWVAPEDILASAASNFQHNLWLDQPAYVEVWFEKDALLMVFERASEDKRLPFISCRGYGSDSAYWQAAERFKEMEHDGKRCVLLHFSDHDPSGLDMTADIGKRLALFEADFVEIRRIALTMGQVRKHNPPPNPAKESDSRYRGYRREWGVHCWELDALKPDVLVKLVASEVNKVIDADKWQAALDKEGVAKDQLSRISNNYERIVKFLNRKKK